MSTTKLSITCRWRISLSTHCLSSQWDWFTGWLVPAVSKMTALNLLSSVGHAALMPRVCELSPCWMCMSYRRLMTNVCGTP